MKTCNEIQWMLEYRCYDLSPWSQDEIMGHASYKDVLKKGKMHIRETSGIARAVNRFTGEVIQINAECSIV